MPLDVGVALYVACGVLAVFALGYFVGMVRGEDRSDAWWRREWQDREARRG